jgi:hypothetical protein
LAFFSVFLFLVYENYLAGKLRKKRKEKRKKDVLSELDRAQDAIASSSSESSSPRCYQGRASKYLLG